MKVFLSWSGEPSRSVAGALRDWIPSVLQPVKPFMSEDISKGSRWATDIARELEESEFGIICLTKNNVNEAWVNFEAGALSKVVDKSKVCPFLFNLRRSEFKGPLLLFQNATYDEKELVKMMSDINQCLDNGVQLEETRLEATFRKWWPELKKQLDEIAECQSSEEKDQTSSLPDGDAQILEELLELVRGQTRLLGNPSLLLPQEYLADAIRNAVERGTEQHATWEIAMALDTQHAELLEVAHRLELDGALEGQEERYRDLRNRIERLRPMIDYLCRYAAKGGNR